MSVKHNLVVVLLSRGRSVKALLRPVLYLALSWCVIFIHNVVEISPLILSGRLVSVHGVVCHIFVSASSLCHRSRDQHGWVAMASALRLGSGR